LTGAASEIADSHAFVVKGYHTRTLSIEHDQRGYSDEVMEKFTHLRFAQSVP
jgi:hypothetical protein